MLIVNKKLSVFVGQSSSNLDLLDSSLLTPDSNYLLLKSVALFTFFFNQHFEVLLAVSNKDIFLSICDLDEDQISL